MKFFWLFPLCLALYACPLESPVPLDEKPLIAMDTAFIGYWYGIIKDGSDFFGIEALDIRRQSDSVCNITRYGKSVKGNMIVPDTAIFTGYLSRVGEQLFMNIESGKTETIPNKKKEPAIKTKKLYYLASIQLRHDTLTVNMITENFAGLNPRFRTPADVRNAILTLTAENKNIFDDQYKLSYRKMARPF